MNFKLIAILISFISLHNIQQKPGKPTANEIEHEKIAVVNRSGNSFNSGSREQLQKSFGKTKMVKEKAEVFEGEYAYIYKYKGLEVTYSQNHCEATEIKGVEYHIVLNGISYYIGDPIIKLKTAFPLSYKNRKDNFISLWIKGADAWVAFSYNSKGIINSIEVANNNS